MIVLNMDSNYWGLFIIPVGLIICFGPALLAAIFHPSEDPNIAERGKPRD
jgi:hypothetical protein